MQQPETSFIQAAIEQSIRQNPEAAAREVPMIIGHYILDNTRLNRVYQVACRAIVQPDKTNRYARRKAVEDAQEGGL